jgi:acyl carrier protein
MSTGDVIQNGVATFYATIEIKDIIIKKFKHYLKHEYDFIFDIESMSDFNIYENGYIDSLTGVEFVMELEKEFNVYFNDNDTENIILNCSVNNIYLILTQYIKPSDK